MPAIINSGDSEAVVKQKIIDILEFDGINTDNIVSWGTVTNRLNSAAFMLGLPQIDNGLAGATTRERINALALSPAPVFPINTVLPSISGTPRYNQQLTGNIGTWNAYPAATYTYQWKADGVNISGATAQNYTLLESDLGKVITLEVSATNQSGNATATSAATAIVTSIPINTSIPVISGTIANGQVVSTSNGIWIAYPAPTYTYQWKADGVNISGATSATYTLQNSEVGKAISVSVVATNSQGNATATSANTTLVTSIPVNTALPIVAAEAVEGQVISTTNGTWVGHPAITYTYQWRRNSVNISGATSASYTIVTADVGQNISVTVTATNSQGNTSTSSVDQIARPTWAVGVDSWRNFASDIGNFANPTDTHSTAINAPNAAGVYSSFAPNVLVRTNQGVQTVPTRTNKLTNSVPSGAIGNNTPTGWSVAGGVAGVTRTILSYGVEDGLPYTEMALAGTATGNGSAGYNFGPQLTAAVPGETSTGSVFVKIIRGTGLGSLGVGFLETVSGTPTFPSTNLALPADGTRVRPTYTRTHPAGTTAAVPFAIVGYLNGAVVDAVVRFYAPQMEVGAFATPPILTTGTAATVTGNQQVITGLGPSLVTGVAGFVQFDAKALFSSGGQGVRILNFYGASADYCTLRYNLAADSYVIERVNSGTIVAQHVQAGASTGITTIAFVFVAGLIYAQKVGGIRFGSTDAAVYPVMDKVSLGGAGSTSGVNSYQFTRKIALDYLAPGDDPATKFNEVFAKAQLAAAAP